MFRKKNTSSADALIEAARAEMAAKRKLRETQFADTVLGWESEEEAAAADDPFPQTVIGWDQSESGDRPHDPRLSVLLAMERAQTEATHQQTKRWIYGISIALMLLLILFFASAWF